MHRPEWCGFQASGGAGKVRRRGRDATAPGARAGLIWRRERAGASGPGAGFAAELAPGARSVAGGRAARSAARRAGRCSAARERFPRGPFSRSGFPLLYIFLKFLIAVEIKHLLVPSRPRAGRVPAVLRAPRRAGAGLPARGWRELRAQPPPGLAVGRPRAEYLCYILKNLNK